MSQSSRLSPITPTSSHHCVIKPAKNDTAISPLTSSGADYPFSPPNSNPLTSSGADHPFLPPNSHSPASSGADHTLSPPNIHSPASSGADHPLSLPNLRQQHPHQSIRAVCLDIWRSALIPLCLYHCLCSHHRHPAEAVYLHSKYGKAETLTIWREPVSKVLRP